MAVRFFWAEPGPKAEAALRQYWAMAYEMADDILRREALAEIRGTTASEPDGVPTYKDTV